MNRKLCIGIVSCILAMGLHAETARVLRFVPVAGAESEVAVDSLQKVVFTSDDVGGAVYTLREESEQANRQDGIVQPLYHSAIE